jgi:branched-chain amino acid transport system substrate-binding protein
MTRRYALILAVCAGLAAVVAGCGSSSSSSSSGSAAPASGSGGKNPILIGISAAKTGVLAPYDLQSGQLFQMRINQINQSGGVLGRQLKVTWLDTKSDKPTAATNAQELISNGAVAIIATCDFDYSYPAISTAASHKVPGIALCASSPKVATPAIVSQYGGSMGLGSDTEGSTMAEWMRSTHPQWKRVYVFKDTSLEYSKATADYFKARFQQLGGQVCGADTFVGGPGLDLSSQITRLRGAESGCDVIFDGSWQPFGSQLIRAIRAAGINKPITTNASVNGTLVTQVGGKVSNYYALGFACLPTYCQGTQTPLVRTIASQFQSTYGTALGNHYALPGYALADAVVAAIKSAGSTDGTKLAQALFGGGVTVDYFGHTMKFTSNCHRPQPAAYSVEQFTNGVDKQIGTWKVHSVPNIGDGSPCSGTPPAP